MTAKNVLWVHRFGESVASYRYRAQIPCQEVAKINGYRTAMNDGEADIVVFSKPTVEEIPIALKAKADGAKIIADFADDHFGHVAVGPVYLKFAEIADGIVTSSAVMRGIVYDHTKRDSVAIADPYEQEEREPHCDGDAFLWFGHSRNLNELLRVRPFLQGRKVMIATGPQAPPGYTPIWGPQALSKAFEQCNIALLPTQPGAEYKSPNRLLNAIRAGLFPVCMDHPAYKEFRRFVWVGDFATGMRWVDAFKSDLNGLVREAQDYIRDRYSPAAIGAQWAAFLEAV